MIQHSDSQRLFDFSDHSALKSWYIVNDGVMGGLSKSSFKFHEDGYAVFAGNLSLENNGGFASTRTRTTDFNLHSSTQGIKIRVKGDGKKYQFRIHTNALFDGAAYRYIFETSGEWQTINIAFSQCKASFRGRIIPDAPAINPEIIQQFGILVAEKQEGNFMLEIEWINAY
ncbi:MAG: CIA30 family protein [Flavobacteriales bacterium]|nr:MAG: CIA30 family protein [Flavobacteriales bacterium]